MFHIWTAHHFYPAAPIGKSAVVFLIARQTAEVRGGHGEESKAQVLWKK